MRTLWREPLVHFLLLGAGLFGLYGALDGKADDADPQTIVVGREQLLTHLQYRARAFDGEAAEAQIDALPEAALKQLISDYVREEALYREAKALRLDGNDYVARLRLIQQLEFITRGFAENAVEIDENAIERYYESHRDELRVAPKVTFTHVFFSASHGAESAESLARRTLHEMNGKAVRFEQAPAHGDRFLYHVNYVAREPEEVASHFGTAFQQAVFALEPDERQWRGPFASSHGVHLVLLTTNEAGYLPPLAEVRQPVLQAARRAALDARFEQSIQSILNAYTVMVKDEFASASLALGRPREHE